MVSIWEPLRLGTLELKNRLVRAATFEGAADDEGRPAPWLAEAYADLARNQVGLIITGFAYTSRAGHAMQERQCGIDDDGKIPAWQRVTEAVHREGGKIVMQYSHAGRQTLARVTRAPLRAPSAVKCTYFRGCPRALSEEEILALVDEYVAAAARAQRAGFDGVQVHCAHGYLVHQFFSPHTNRRRDRWGGSHENRFRFVQQVLEGIGRACGPDFPVLVKLSTADDRGLTAQDAARFAQLFEATGRVVAIELSYGTMEYAPNIFRGDVPVHLVLQHNPLYRDYPGWVKAVWLRTGFPLLKRKFRPFAENYNAEAGRATLAAVKLPVLLTGGVCSGESVSAALDAGFSGVTLCRPFLREPDFGAKLAQDPAYRSLCTHCNTCVMMCDSGRATRCYRRKRLPYEPVNAAADEAA